MILSYDSVRAILERTFPDGNYDYAHEYGEPGYSFPYGAETPIVVLANYWCRCGKVLSEDGSPDLHDVAHHHPRVFAQLEEQGVGFEWSDEWIIDHENDKAYRCQPDSYSWQPALVITDDGEFLTPDDDLDAWTEYMVNSSHRCLPSRVFSARDLERADWESFNGHYENGWHPGQDDDPESITATIREEYGDGVDVLFLLDESSQFYIGFSAWTRPVERDED